MRFVGLLVVVCACICVAAGGVSAVELKTGAGVVLPKDGPVDDDILAAGKHVDIQSDVEGDITAAGQSVSVDGEVRDSVLLAGDSVSVSGDVGNDAWIAGSTVTLTSSVADNAYMAGNVVSVAQDASVGRDLLLAGNQLRIMGNVSRDVRAAGSDLAIGGKIGGNVYADTAGVLRVLDGAVITGNLYYESPQAANIAPGAKIGGRVEHSLPVKEKRKPVFWDRLALTLWSLIAAIVFGAVMIAVFPERSQDSADTVRRSFWASLGIGLILLIVVPIACLIVAVTLIGIPVALTILAIYLILIYASVIAVTLAFGQWLLGRGRAERPKPIGSMILGLIILALVVQIPVITWIVEFIVVILGLGAICISWWRSRTVQLAPEIAEPETPES